MANSNTSQMQFDHLIQMDCWTQAQTHQTSFLASKRDEERGKESLRFCNPYLFYLWLSEQVSEGWHQWDSWLFENQGVLQQFSFLSTWVCQERLVLDKRQVTELLPAFTVSLPILALWSPNGMLAFPALEKPGDCDLEMAASKGLWLLGQKNSFLATTKPPGTISQTSQAVSLPCRRF